MARKVKAHKTPEQRAAWAAKFKATMAEKKAAQEHANKEHAIQFLAKQARRPRQEHARANELFVTPSVSAEFEANQRRREAERKLAMIKLILEM